MRNKHQWDHQKLRRLEKAHGQCHLKVAFVEFVEVPGGNYFRLVSRERGRKNDKSEDYSKADQNNVYRWRMP